MPQKMKEGKFVPGVTPEMVRESEQELEERYFWFQQFCPDCRKLNGGEKYGEHLCKEHKEEMRQRQDLV
jgi:hypothetical protein